jgi:hypothetical protein
LKKYILFGHILGIGGWQLYIDGKAAYLKENGWEVYVLSSKSVSGNQSIKFDGLKCFENNMMKELIYWPYHFTSRQQNIVLREMVNNVGERSSENDTIIIESTSMYYSFWGEILAKELNAKHFVYLLHSHFEVIPNSWLDYFSFKYDRRELAGMVDETIPALFSGYRHIDKNEKYGLCAAGRNPLCNDAESDAIAESIICKIRDYDYIIGAFGTLNKPHAPQVFEEVKKFVFRHQDKNIVYLVIGSSGTGEVEATILEESIECENLHPILAGEMYPVPEKLFKEMDVCIGSWGSANAAAIAGAKTIRLASDIDVIPQGLIGYTLTKKPYSQYKGIGELNEVLEDVLVNEKYSDMEYIPPSEYPDYQQEHRKHMEFIEQSCEIKEYYNINTIKPPSFKQYLKKYIFMVLGFKKADYCFDLFRKKYN